MLQKTVLLCAIAAGALSMPDYLRAKAVLPAVDRAPEKVDSIAAKTAFRVASELAAVKYDDRLSEQDVLDRAESDAALLGTKVFRTFAIGKTVVFKGSVDSIRHAVSVAETMPVEDVRPAYAPEGDVTPESIIVYTSELMLDFSAATTETAKQEFLASHGFTLLRELASGRVIVNTEYPADSEMQQRATELARTELSITHAAFDFLLSGEPTLNTNSIQANDPFFELYQWYLWNSGNAVGFSQLDQDPDFPRAWMIRKMTDGTRDTPFGSPSVTIALFDTGVETTHPDLMAAIDPGDDRVDGSLPPSPTVSALGAHGTAMAGLISAQINNAIGLVGAAPGIRLYPVRIFGQDYSTSNVALVGALDRTITSDIDVNVHPYVLTSITDLTNSTTQELESTFRRSNESGRQGRGTSNIASTGNFSAQVEYPASSPWTMAVTAMIADGKTTTQANWGGVGPDFSMPGFEPQNGGSAGLVTTDLTSTAGLTGPQSTVAGNELGNYTAIGRNTPFSTTNARNVSEASYLGTSASAALAGAMVGLMYSDARYAELPPLTVGPLNDFPNLASAGADNSRANYRSRAPLRPNANSILAVLKNYSDLPDNLTNLTGQDQKGFAYVGDQSNERAGFGRPNAARIFADNSNGVGLRSPDSLYEPKLTEFCRWDFNSEGPGGALDDPDMAEAFAKGWTATATLKDGDLTISPAMEPFSALYFEDGTVQAPQPVEDAPPNFIYSWTDSLTRAPQGSETSQAANNVAFNPQGRYYRSTPVELTSPLVNLTSPALCTELAMPAVGDVPYVLTVQVAHELGVEDGASAHGNSTASVGDPVQLTRQSTDIDPIILNVTYFSEDGSTKVEVGRLTGDSTANPKRRLLAATTVSPSTNFFEAGWPDGLSPYIPFVAPSEMRIRTYRFVLPTPPSGTTDMQISFRLEPDNSYLPSYSYDAMGMAKQVFNARRDHLGFILYSASLAFADPAYINYLNQTNFAIADGAYPVWSGSGNEVTITQPSASGSFLVHADPEPTLTDPNGDTLQADLRTTPRFLENFDAPVTGMASHPFLEEYVVTTSQPDGSNGAIFRVTNDGINATALVDPSLSVGAREPSYAENGNQIVYCSENYIRLLSKLSDGSYVVETILDETHRFLTDFHSPVLDPTAGVIVFTARRKDPDAADTSLNFYVVTRNGRVVSYSIDANGFANPIVPGWEGIDVYDMVPARSIFGQQRLIFAANAVAPPEYDDSGELIQPAVFSDYPKLFVIENMEQITRSANAAPLYTTVDLKPLSPLPLEELSARMPAVARNRRDFAWIRFDGPQSVAAQHDQGKVIRQLLGAGSPLPSIPEETPTPTPSNTVPPPTPTPVDNSQVTLTGRYDFDATIEDWSFNNGGFTSNPAIANFEFVNGIPERIEPGLVGFLASSPTRVTGQNTRVAVLRFQATQDGLATFGFSTEPPRMTKVLDENAEEVGVSFGKTLTVLGNDKGTDARLFIDTPSVAVSRGDFLQIAVRLDPNSATVRQVLGYITYNASLLNFDSGQVDTATFNENRSIGALNLTANNSNNVFGFWVSPDSAIQVRPNALYLYRANVVSNGGIPASQVPTVRLRVNSSNFESAFTAGTNSLGDLSLSPNPDAAKSLDLLFRPPDGLFTLPTLKWVYIVSFDMLNFLSDDSPNGGITLENVELYRFDDAPKYYALWGFEVPEGGTTFSASVVGDGSSNTPLSMSIRNCCSFDEGDLVCANSGTATQVSLTNRTLAAGFYTLVASGVADQNVFLTWSSSAELLPNLGENCTRTSSAKADTTAELCSLRVPLAGTGDSSVEVRPIYDGRGYFPMPSCDSSESISVVKSIHPVYAGDMRDRDVRATWSQGPESSPFDLPAFSTSSNSLNLAATGRDNVFGYWTTDPEIITPLDLSVSAASPVVVFKATYVLRNESSVAPLSFPDIRLRLSTGDFQRDTSAVLISLTDGISAPVAGKPRTAVVYMVLEQPPANLDFLIAAFDVLAFYPQSAFPNRVVTSDPIKLEFVKVERVDIPNYPAPR